MLAATPFDRPGLGRSQSEKSKASLTLPPISELYRIADRYPTARPRQLTCSPLREKIPLPSMGGRMDSTSVLRTPSTQSLSLSPQDEPMSLPSPPATPLSARSSLSSASSTQSSYLAHQQQQQMPAPSSAYYRSPGFYASQKTLTPPLEGHAPMFCQWGEPSYQQGRGWGFVPHSPAVSESYLTYAAGPPHSAWSSVPIVNSRKRSSSEADVLKGGAYALVNEGQNPKYKKRSRNHAPSSCDCCGCSDAPEWRRGPNGPRTLCNACGLQFSKMNRDEKTLAASPTGKVTVDQLQQAMKRIR